MSRVVFLGLPALGHINPTIGIVKELIARGEEVIYYSTPEFQPRIKSMGADFRAYPFAALESGTKIIGLNGNLINPEINTVGPLNQLGRQIIDKMGLYIQIMNNQTFNLKKEVAAINPGYIIHDSCAYWGKVLAKQMAIPAIASVTTFAYCDQMLQQYPQFVAQRILEFTGLPADPSLAFKLLRRISKMIGDLLKITDFDCIDKDFSQEAINIVYTSKEFQWHGEVFDAAFKFVGPSFYPRNDSGEFPFARLTGESLIYISLGTLLSSHDFYRKCFAAFGDSGRQVVLNTGNIYPAELGSVPGNFIVSRFTPQLDILKRAGLFITHGGMNGVNEALYFDVPLLVIPHRWDQHMVADRVTGLGAGIALKNMEFTARELYEAAEQIFANVSYRDSRKVIGKSLRAAGGYREATEEIFKFKIKNGIS